MPAKQFSQSGQISLEAQLVEPGDLPFRDAARALVKAGFLFVNQLARPYQKYDLTLAQMDVLGALARAEDATLNCSEIAESTLITKGGITGILDRLEARALVKRIPSRDDRRSVLIRLSAKGAEMYSKIYPELVRAHRSILESAFKPEQMKEFSILLQLLIHTLESGWGKSADVHAGL